VSIGVILYNVMPQHIFYIEIDYREHQKIGIASYNAAAVILNKKLCLNEQK